MNKSTPKSTLSRGDMVALTANFPCSKDNDVNMVIYQSLRLKTSAQILEGIMRTFPHHEAAFATARAIEYADALLAHFFPAESDK